jgi:hypothetical protein
MGEEIARSRLFLAWFSSSMKNLLVIRAADEVLRMTSSPDLYNLV